MQREKEESVRKKREGEAQSMHQSVHAEAQGMHEKRAFGSSAMAALFQEVPPSCMK